MTEPTVSSRDGELSSTPAPPPKQEKASLLDDFMDIFYAPSAVYARRANKSFWVPLLIISVLTVIGTLISDILLALLDPRIRLGEA